MVVAVCSYRLRIPYGSSPTGSYFSADLASVFKKLGHPSTLIRDNLLAIATFFSLLFLGSSSCPHSLPCIYISFRRKIHVYSCSGGQRKWNLVRASDMQEVRCLGAVYSITTFIRDMRTLLQIRQFARLRSASCSLQGLSSTQRSARETPSRDLTVGVEEQKRNPKRLSVPRSRKSTREDRIERNPKVAVLPPMGEGHQPVVVGILLWALRCFGQNTD